MTPIRILHASDIHFDRENQEAALASLGALLAHGAQNGVDLWAIAGDLFNRAASNTAAAGFPRLIAILQRLLALAPVVAVKGTPTHDIDGCYEALQEIKADHAFELLDPRSAYFLHRDGSIRALTADPEDSDLLILGCPEPSKEWFLAGEEGLGRDEATQAVKDGMRQLLLGLGAIRRQYADLPCLMVYHGAVEGASLCNGQVLRPGELAIGRDDLALVGADYFALGHIHLAQRVGDLPAYYAGSAYPCNWGETDQKGFYEVEFDSALITRGLGVPVHQVPFPHPPRRKLVKELTDEISREEVAGFQVWVVHRIPKDVPFSDDTVLPFILDIGALPGSRVTVEIIPTETVRAGQIAEARGLPDKLRIYAENSGEQLSEPLLMKAAFLESEARAAGQAPEGLHVRIDRLHLRGAIGIWKGLGLDEVDLDLAGYDPGLIALVGTNGCLIGSTLIDIPRDLSKHPAGIPIRDLVGTEPLVYCYDGKRIVLARATNVRRTGIGRQVYRVRFTSRSRGRFSTPLEIVGTADHPIMLRDGNYKPLGELRAGDRLMPLYRRSRDGKYVWIDRNDGSFILEHRLVAEQATGHALRNDEHAHHIDKNPLNNSEGNIAALASVVHRALHGIEKPPHYDQHPRGMLGKRHAASVIDRIKKSMRRRWSDPRERARRTEAARQSGFEQRLPTPSAEHLHRLYVEEGLSTTAIGLTFDVSDPTVARWLRRRDISVRAPGKRKVPTNHRVLSVEPAGYQDVYDIEVPAHHCFVANGVVVHNSGKTTFIENMHPYPEMLTRSGTLQEHFRLKDSFRELYFTDERAGAKYRALIQIDGANASGRTEYHLFRGDTGPGWNGEGSCSWIPLTNGRKADYEEAIERLFGSLALFVRSAFVSQKPPKGHPDLTDATKGEKKALFRELAGLDYLQTYSEAAREKAKVLEAETERDAGRVEAMQGQLAGREDKMAELGSHQADLQAKSTELLGLESQGKSAAARMEELRGKVERNREIEQRIRESENRQEKLRAEVDHIESARTTYQAALAGRPAAEKALAEIEALKAEEGKLHGEQAEVLKERERINHQHVDAQRAITDRRRKVEAAQATMDREIAVLAQKAEAAAARVDELGGELVSTIECPACHHRFHPDADAVRAKIAQQQGAGYELGKEIQEKKRELAQLDQDEAKIVDPPAPELPTFDDSRLKEIAKLHLPSEEDILRHQIRAADEAAVRIQEGEKRKAQIVQELAELGAKLQEDRGKLLGPELEEAFADARRELANLEALYRSCRDGVKTLEAVVASLEKQLAELDQVAQELETLRDQVAGKQQDAADWRWLERSCGPDGIQALELDALGPSIADTANKLLSAAYGSRFQLSFRTTRIGGSGSKKHLLEDFQVWIHDSEHGDEQLIENLSGGESIWIKRALYDAFGIMRDKNTGQRFLTVFMDEMDGALDPESRLKYFNMIEAAHAESGRKHTLIVTHSESAQEMITQHIAMAELAEVSDAT